MKRVALVLLLGSSIAALAIVGVLTWVLRTEAGSAWALERVEALAGPQLSVGSVRGTFWSGLVLSDVTVQLPGGEGHAEQVELVWNVAELLTRAIEFEELFVSELSYVAMEPATDVVSTAQAAFPFRVLVQRGSVDRFVYLSEETIEIGPVSFSLTLDGDRLVTEDIVASAFGVDLRGRAALRLRPDPPLSAEIDWTTVLEEVLLEGRGRVDGVLSAFEVRQELIEPFQVVTEGEIRLGDAPGVDLAVQWSDLAWPSIAAVESPTGGMRLVGWFDAYTFDGDGVVNMNDIGAEFSAVGSGAPTQIVLDALALSSAHGEIEAVGRIDLDPLTWELDIEGQDVDPSAYFDDWPGALAGRGMFSGGVEPSVRWSFHDGEVEGVLRGQAVGLAGDLDFVTPNAWQLAEVRLNLGGNSALLHGRIDQVLDLDITVNASEVDLLWPEGSGELIATGRLTGPVEAPGFAGVVSGRELQLGEYAAGALAINGDIAFVDDVPVSLSIQGEGISWRDLVFQSVSGQISGRSSAHTVEIDTQSEFGAGRLRAGGAFSEGAWEGRLTTLSLDQDALGSWELDEPAALGVGQEFLRLERACIRQGEASLCGAAQIGSDTELMEVTLSDFDLAVLNEFVTEGLSVQGRYDASLELVGPLATPTGQFNAVGTETVVRLTEGDGAPLEVPIERVEIDAIVAEQTMAIDASLRGEAGAQVALDADVTDLWTADPGLRAQLTGLWTDMGVLSLLSPDVGEVSGTGSLDLFVSGSLREPLVRGEASWSEGQLSVPRWGFVIDGIEVSASSPDATSLTFEGEGTAGEGRIEVEGSMALDPEAGWPMRLSIRGDSLQAVQLPDAEVFVSPDLEVQTALPSIDVSGIVRIPQARLLLDEVPAQAAVPSTDTVVHGEAVRAPPRPLNVHADLRVILGDDITYSGAGLDAVLTGEMGLVYDSGRNAVASGAVNLDGEYRAYGQVLELDRGQLLFSGPMENPGLDVRAVRRIDATTVGVQLGGTLQAPTTRIFSEPAMSEADALSYLLLGRPLSSSGGEETATLESAAVSMGLQQALPAIQRVGQSLGLDEFSVQTTAADTGELMAGKQVTPRVYIRYSYGLFNRIGGLLMRFRLNDRLSLETRSGDYKAMDLLYTVEKD